MGFEYYLLHDEPTKPSLTYTYVEKRTSFVRTIQDLRDKVEREHIGSFPQAKSWSRVEIRAYKCSAAFKAEEGERVKLRLGTGENPLAEDTDLRYAYDGHPEIVVVISEQLQFKLLLFKNYNGTYAYFDRDEVESSFKDRIQVIYDAAESKIAATLATEDWSNISTVCKPLLYEVGKEKYQQTERTEQLGPNFMARCKGPVSFCEADREVQDIDTPYLIFVFGVVQKRKLHIPYVAFHHHSNTYRFFRKGYVDRTAEDTVASFLEIEHIGGSNHARPIHKKVTRSRICAYEPLQWFQQAYNKPPEELQGLRLDNQSLSTNCKELRAEQDFSRWREGQTLVVVFDDHDITGLIKHFGRIRLTNDPPSEFALLTNYVGIQNDPQERILDNRPEQDRLIARIDLLYRPFGYFDDVRRGVEIPGQETINDQELWIAVEALAADMLQFYDDEKEQSSKFIQHLNNVFKTQGTIAASRVSDGKSTTDSHRLGAHGAIMFCMNEVTSGDCDPIVQLVAYIAASFNNSIQIHEELFKRWRVPALVMTHVGPNVFFSGVVWVGQMRVVPLTPGITMARAAGTDSRRNLVWAFKAACLVLSRIQADVDDLVKLIQSQPEANWPPLLTEKTLRFPAITEVDAFPDSKSEKLKFIINFRHDELDDRHLYHARLISPPMVKGKDVYIKFTQRYSVELHEFCASKKLAPAILGFEKLSGGWYAVVMEKIDEVYFSRGRLSVEHKKHIREHVGRLKKSVSKLVDEFHGKGFVHGDLRLENFVFTESEGALKMLLVDFDWGGKEGVAVFPPIPLDDELGVGNRQFLNRRITIEHDCRCLEKAFQRLNWDIRQGSL